MRRYKVEHGKKENATWIFKGSVFVQFAKLDNAKKFLEADKLMYKGTELIRMTKECYLLKKSDEEKLVREKQKQNKQDRNIERKKVQEELKEHADNKILNKMTKRAILLVKNIPSNTKMEDLKEFWRGHGNIAYVEYETGDTEAHCRFYAEDDAPTALEAATKAAEDGKIMFNENQLEVALLEGDAEMQYWKRRFDVNRKLHGGSRGGHRGGFQSKRRRFDD